MPRTSPRTPAATTTSPRRTRPPWSSSATETCLDGRLSDPAELHGLLVPAEDEPLAIYPVVRLVNNVRNDGQELIAPLAG